MEVMDKTAPIICAECKSALIKGKYLYCEEMKKTIYDAKPKWCPHPTWVEIPDQISMFE